MYLEALYEAIRVRLNDAHTSNIGIVGLPGSGKTTISNNLGIYLGEQGIAAVHWEGDMYSTSSREQRTKVIEEEFREKKRRGLPIDPDWPRKAYHYNIHLLVEHLNNFKNRKDFVASGLCHPKRKSLDLDVAVQFDSPNSINIIMEGQTVRYKGNPTWVLADWALLTKQGIREHLDLLIYVGASYAIRAERIRKRLLGLPKPINLEEDLFKSIEPSQIRDFEVYPERTHILIDNNDYENPQIIRC